MASHGSAKLTLPRFENLLSFVAGVGIGIILPVGGNLTAAEAIILIWAAREFLSARPKNSLPFQVLIINICMFVSVLVLAISDLVMGSLFIDVYKTWVRFLSVALLFGSVTVLFTRKVFSDHAFFLGSIPGVIIAVYTHAAYVDPSGPWKYNVAAWVGLGGVVLLRQKTFLLVLALLLFAVINSFLEFRTLVLVSFGTAIVILTRGVLTKLDHNRKLLWRTGSYLAVGLAVALGGVAYNSIAVGGLLGSHVQGKQTAQLEARGGLAENSRPEFMIDVEAIEKSPILPWGSNPSDPDLAAEFIDKAKLGSANAYLESASRVDVPIHSILFDAWIRSGIVGAFVWAAILVICLIYVDTYIGNRVADPYRLFASILTIWNILFSPISPQYRVTLACIFVPIAFELFSLPRRMNMNIPRASIRPKTYPAGAFRKLGS